MNEHLGSTMQVCGEFLVVGTDDFTSDFDESRAVYLFELATGRFVRALVPDVEFSIHDQFGSKLGASGKLIAVGARSNQRELFPRFGCDVFILSCLSGKQLFEFKPSAIAQRHYFGTSAIGGNLIVAGSSAQSYPPYFFGQEMLPVGAHFSYHPARSGEEQHAWQVYGRPGDGLGFVYFPFQPMP
ncbi:MAG: hypothetical protein R3F11_28665 [Verrucomicrobiales bacterium]